MRLYSDKATIFLLLLCNDQDVLGPWVNKTWLNGVASVIVGTLVVLSLILAATTLFPSWDVTLMAELLGAVLVVSLTLVGLVQLRRRRGDPAVPGHGGPGYAADRMTWRMPLLAELPRPV